MYENNTVPNSFPTQPPISQPQPPIQQPAPNPATGMSPVGPQSRSNVSILRIVRSILFVIIGVIAIGLSIKVSSMRTGDWEPSHSYGGDAYTGIQNASAQVSKNTLYTNEILCTGFGSVLAISGLGFIACGATGFKKD